MSDALPLPPRPDLAQYKKLEDVFRGLLTEVFDAVRPTRSEAGSNDVPEHAGLQLPLLELLIDHGAVIDGPDGGSAVNGCLHNGHGEAAEFFASRGGPLDLEGAAGVGRLDVVKSFFDDDGGLKPTATEQQANDGFAWACEFGRTSVVEFLLERGVKIDAKLKHDGQTGLHWAACGGHAETVDALLRRGARVDAKDDSYGGTPLRVDALRVGKRGGARDQARTLLRSGCAADPGRLNTRPAMVFGR
jgi:hypothetical protein